MPLITLAEAARLYNIRLRTLHSRVHRGTLKTVQAGYHQRRYVDPFALMDWKPKEHRKPKQRGVNYRRVNELAGQGYKNIEIAKELGISRERVRQLKIRA